MDKLLQLNVEVPKTNYVNAEPCFGIKFHIEQIFIKFKDIIPDNLKSMFNYLVTKKIYSTDFDILEADALMRVLNIYDVSDLNSDETVYTYRIGIIWNDDFNDFEWINYDKDMYRLQNKTSSKA